MDRDAARPFWENALMAKPVENTLTIKLMLKKSMKSNWSVSMEPWELQLLKTLTRHHCSESTVVKIN
jgi:hypothetical protein